MNSRRYNLVMYQELEVLNFIDACLNNRGKNISRIQYAYILHDKDIDKKPHYHIYCEFPSSVKDRDLFCILDKINLPHNYLSFDKTTTGFLAYLTHSTRESIGVKTPYDYENIVSNIPDLKYQYEQAIIDTNKLSYQEKKIQAFSTMIENVKDIIENNFEITDFSSLSYYLMQNGFYQELDFIMKRCYAIKNAFSNTFIYNSIKLSSSQLKSENRARIEQAKDEYNDIENDSKKIDRLENNLEALKYGK